MATTTVSKKTSLKRGPRVSGNLRVFLENAVRDDLVVTPIIDRFLIEWDGVLRPEVAKRIVRLMSKPERNRSGSWSASGAGKCMRRQEFAFLGMPQVGATSTQGQAIFNNGKWVHMRWQSWGLQSGIFTAVEKTYKWAKQIARCTLDGLGIALDGRYEGQEFGFELKGRNDWEWNKQTVLGVDDITRAQVDFEFLLTGLDLFVIMNENKNTQAKKEWVFVRDDDRVTTMRKRLRELNRAIDIGRLHPMLPECSKQLRDGEFYKCPYGTPGGVCASAGRWPRGV